MIMLELLWKKSARLASFWKLGFADYYTKTLLDYCTYPVHIYRLRCPSD